MNTLLKVDNVSLSFGTKKVLKDVNFEVKNLPGKGQVITLLGRSGVGKSQLLKIIAGLQKPTSGQVLIGTEQKPVKAGDVGMVLQNYPLFEHRTIRSNFELASQDKDKIQHYAEEFDIVDCLGKYPSQLSGGQKQRSAIIQQLLCSDTFILLDEPFSGLDPVAIKKLCLNIEKVVHHHDDNTVIISSHILEPTIAISDTVLMLHKGDEGAFIGKKVDLIAEGLAWRPDVMADPKFAVICEQLRNSF